MNNNSLKKKKKLDISWKSMLSVQPCAFLQFRPFNSGHFISNVDLYN